MRWWCALLPAAVALAAPSPVLAAHTEALRGVEDELTVSTGALALFAVTTFLVAGAMILFGFRYLYRSRDERR